MTSNYITSKLSQYAFFRRAAAPWAGGGDGTGREGAAPRPRLLAIEETSCTTLTRPKKPRLKSKTMITIFRLRHSRRRAGAARRAMRAHARRRPHVRARFLSFAPLPSLPARSETRAAAPCAQRAMTICLIKICSDFAGERRTRPSPRPLPRLPLTAVLLPLARPLTRLLSPRHQLPLLRSFQSRRQEM